MEIHDQMQQQRLRAAVPRDPSIVRRPLLFAAVLARAPSSHSALRVGYARYRCHRCRCSRLLSREYSRRSDVVVVRRHRLESMNFPDTPDSRILWIPRILRIPRIPVEYRRMLGDGCCR